MNVAGPDDLQAPVDRPSPARRAAETFNLVYHGTMAERLGVDLLIRAVARLRERIPGLRLHLWGHGDDLRRVPAAGAGARRRGHGPLQAEGVSAAASFPAPRRDGPRRRRQPAERGRRPDAAGQADGIRLPGHTGRRAAADRRSSTTSRTTWSPTTSRRMSQSLADVDLPALQRAGRTSTAGRSARIEFLGEYGWERQGAELVTFYQQLRGELKA